ncbi:MAG: hypothetical protein LBU66_00675 [Treponema sp.]|jgi:hypothetical protein|nr:hypothetical protein [Treponema sp.]
MCFTAFLSAQTETQITVLANPETPVAGSPFTLTFLVDHNVPDEVNVIAPSFPAGLALDRYVKSPRVTGAKVQTAFEYRFIPSRSGRVMLDAFTFVFPGGITRTEQIVLNIQGALSQEPVTLRLVWENDSGQPVARQLAAGEQAVLILRVNRLQANGLPASNSLEALSSLSQTSQLTQRDFFMPEVPPQAILSSIPLTETERVDGTVLKLSLIPLEGDFYLPARVLRYSYFTFEIPDLRINITNRPAVAIMRETPLADSSERQIEPQNEDLNENYYIEKKYFPRFSLGFYTILIIVIMTPFICFTIFKKK